MKHKATTTRKELFNAPMGWIMDQRVWIMDQRVECSCGKWWSKTFGPLIIGTPSEKDVLKLHERHRKYHEKKAK